MLLLIYFLRGVHIIWNSKWQISKNGGENEVHIDHMLVVFAGKLLHDKRLAALPYALYHQRFSARRLLPLQQGLLYLSFKRNIFRYFRHKNTLF